MILISRLRVFTTVLSFLVSSNTFSHGGGLDTNGGHNNRKIGAYHCHRDYCKPRGINNKVAFKEAGYNRKNWRHWIDNDKDCQNTRAEILIAASLENVSYRNGKTCSVYSGKWYDPYSDKVWTLASDVDIDHIVPLAWAYAHGASDWSSERKAKFANDSENLIAVKDNINQAKGAKGPEQWLPPNYSFRCEYVNSFQRVVERYGLVYTTSEEVLVKHYIKRCAAL